MAMRLPKRGQVLPSMPRGARAPRSEDLVRGLFVAVAVIAIVTLPLLGNLLLVGTFFQVAGIVLLILLAGITHTEGRGIMLWNVIISALGALFLESAAISGYASDSGWLSLARETSAIFLLFALYFSTRSLRRMMGARRRERQ